MLVIKNHLRLIASTSTLLLIFSHEVKSLLGTLEASKNALKGIVDNLDEKDAATVKEVINDLGDSKIRFSELIAMTSLIGVDSKNAPEKRLSLKDHIETAIKCFRLIIGKYEIKIDYEGVAGNVMVGPLQEAELYAILLNVLSNSIKAVIAGGKEKKEIKISAEKAAGITRISIRDNGIGLSEEHFEDVFVPFISDPEKELYSKLKKNLNPEDRFIVGSGSGLGLSIIKELIEAKKGTITFMNPTGKWNAHLEFTLL